jgi:hypothetical protein
MKKGPITEKKEWKGKNNQFCSPGLFFNESSVCVNQVVDVLFCIVSNQLNKTDFLPRYEDWENGMKIRLYSTNFNEYLRFVICYFRNLSFRKFCTHGSSFTRNVSPSSSADGCQDAKQPAAFALRLVD